MDTSESDLPALRGFKDARQSTFRVAVSDDEVMTLTLVEIAEHPAREGWERFALLFDGPPAPAPFWQGTFTVEHDDLGAFLLFLVAVLTDAGAQQYEAVFHRRTSGIVS